MYILIQHAYERDESSFSMLVPRYSDVGEVKFYGKLLGLRSKVADGHFCNRFRFSKLDPVVSIPLKKRSGGISYMHDMVCSLSLCLVLYCLLV